MRPIRGCLLLILQGGPEESQRLVRASADRLETGAAVFVFIRDELAGKLALLGAFCSLAEVSVEGGEGAQRAQGVPLNVREVLQAIRDFHDRKIEPTAVEVVEAVGMKTRPLGQIMKEAGSRRDATSSSCERRSRRCWIAASRKNDIYQQTYMLTNE